MVENGDPVLYSPQGTPSTPVANEQVFISYDPIDSALLEQFIPKLREAYKKQYGSSLTVWYDKALEESKDGRAWWETILENIAKSSAFIYICSPESIASAYCNAEKREADRLGIEIIPLVITNDTPVRPLFGDIPPITLVGLDITNTDVIKGLVRRLKELIAMHQARGYIEPATAAPTGQPVRSRFQTIRQTVRRTVETRLARLDPQSRRIAVGGVAAAIAVIALLLILSAAFQRSPTPTATVQAAIQGTGQGTSQTSEQPPQQTPGGEPTAEVRPEVEVTTLSSESNGTFIVTVRNDATNIRSGPTTSSDRLASVKRGDRLRIDGEYRESATVTWYRVLIADDLLGWVRSNLVTLDDPAVQIPVIETIPTEASPQATSQSTDSATVEATS